MFVNIILGVSIFGFAAWTIVRHIRNSSDGKCEACAMKSGCEARRLPSGTYVKNCDKKG